MYERTYNTQVVLPDFRRCSTKAWVNWDECNNCTTWADHFTSGSLTCKRSADAHRKLVSELDMCMKLQREGKFIRVYFPSAICT